MWMVWKEEGSLPVEQPGVAEEEICQSDSALGARVCKQQDQRQQWREEFKNSIELNAEDNSSRTGARWHT